VTSLRYLRFLGIGALCGLVYTALAALAIGSDAMMQCDPHGVDATHYMAYCNVKSFTEYDLGAHYFGLEPEAIKSMQGADILFLGNSRAGHTFSSAATRDFMETLSAKYYVLAFGYESSSTSALSLIDKYHLHPKIMIINADPFFSSGDQDEREKLSGHRPDIYLGYLLKRAFQHIQPSLCRSSAIFCGHALTVYRSVVTGAWDIRQYAAAHSGSRNPKIIVEDEGNRWAELPDTLNAARDFVERLSLDPACIIVTSIPSPHSTQGLAKAAATAVGAPYVAPTIADLHTFDDSHLTLDDDERWSAEMLREASGQIRRCLPNDQ
jgi:hypothetical protein